MNAAFGSASLRSIGRKAAAAVVVGVAFIAISGQAAEAECTNLLGCPAPAPTTTSTTVATPPTTVPPTTSTTVPAVRDDTADNTRLLALMNAERTRHNLPQFTLRSDVSSIALPHSRNMAAKHTIWHNDDYFSSANRTRLGAGAMAENVAMNSSVEGAHVALMNSPPHRANLLDPRMTVVGLGITIDNRNMYYVTQDFLQPRTSPAPAPKPASSGSAPAKPGAASNPRPVAARPATSSPAVRPSSPVAVNSQVLAASDTATDSELAMRPEIVQAPMRLRFDPVKASDDYTGLQLAIIWVAGLLFLSSLPPVLRLGWQTARQLRTR